MSKIPFYVGKLVAMFVPGKSRRGRVRGNINIALYRPRISAFIKREFNEKVEKIKFVRQINSNRFVCVVNDKYYVKVFRNITLARLKEHKWLVDFVRPYLSVTIPEIHLHSRIPMYVCEKIGGHPISDFDLRFLLKNEEKLEKQLRKIIKQIQSINLESIPDYNRFWFGLQPERQPEKPILNGKKVKPVLAHFDLNETNLFFDDDFNITGVIDWDTLSIAKNPETDINVFRLFWERYKRSQARKQGIKLPQKTNR